MRLPAFYARIQPAIHKIDPNHILWLDGNTFAGEWIGFDKALPNSVYSIHDYSTFGFPTFEQFDGSEEQKQKLERQYLRKAEPVVNMGTPVWNGKDLLDCLVFPCLTLPQANLVPCTLILAMTPMPLR